MQDVNTNINFGTSSNVDINTSSSIGNLNVQSNSNFNSPNNTSNYQTGNVVNNASVEDFDLGNFGDNSSCGMLNETVNSISSDVNNLALSIGNAFINNPALVASAVGAIVTGLKSSSLLSNFINQNNIIGTIVQEPISDKILSIKSFLENNIGILSADQILEIAGLTGEMSMDEAVHILAGIYAGDEIASIKENRKDGVLNYYSLEQVQEIIDAIKDKYTGREASVRSVLAMLAISFAQGVKIPYTFGAGHRDGDAVLLETICKTSDCSALTSWAVQQGAVNEFTTTVAKTIRKRGADIELADAKPGDAVATKKHVRFVVSNNPDNKTMIIAEEADSQKGLVIREFTYNDLRNYKPRDLSEYYG